MSPDNTNYKSIFKATAFLGSVQFFNIIIGVVRNKVVSILLGPGGMGIVGILQSTVTAINGISNCGLTFSALKNISVAYEENDLVSLGKVVYVIKRLLWLTGLVASAICISMSKQLSIWSFGNEDFTIPYCWLSISLFLQQLTNGNLMIIKCCRQLKMFAKANVIGNFCSLFITIPLYFIWGVDAIVPALILLSLSTFILSFIYERKLNVQEYKVDKIEFKEISLDIFKIGIAIAIASVLPDCLAYYLRIFMSSHGGVEDVGYYAAGFAILNTYVGMIFSAMSNDYIPRLSAVVDDNSACQDTVNKQNRIAAMILLPVLTAFIVFSKLIVRVLYTEQFYPMIGMMMWGAVGCFIRSADWSIGNLYVPKRDTKAYLIINWLAAFISIGSNILFYLMWGVTGLGVAIIVVHLSGLIISSVYMKMKYNIVFEKDVVIMTVLGSLFLVFMIVVNNIITIHFYFMMVINALMIIGACLFSYKNLNKYMGVNLFSIIRAKIK